MTYAVVWRENGGDPYAGQLALAPGRLVLSGTAPGARDAERALRYDELAGAHLDRRERPLLVILDRRGSRLEVSSLEGAGALHELAQELEVLRGKAASRG